jgi:hypothetical protein
VITTKTVKKAATTFYLTNVWQPPVKMEFDFASAAQVLDAAITMEIQ